MIWERQIQCQIHLQDLLISILLLKIWSAILKIQLHLLISIENYINKAHLPIQYLSIRKRPHRSIFALVWSLFLLSSLEDVTQKLLFSIPKWMTQTPLFVSPRLGPILFSLILTLLLSLGLNYFSLAEAFTSFCYKQYA